MNLFRKQAVWPVMGPPKFALATCKWWFEQRPRAFSSAWRSPRVLVMQLIVLHLYIKLDVRWPSRSEDTADFWSQC